MIDRIRFVRKTCNWRLEVTFITEEKWKKVKKVTKGEMTKEMTDLPDYGSK